MNNKLIEEFIFLRDEANFNNQRFREKAFEKIINILKKIDYKININNYKDLKKISGVGNSSITKIKYILTGNTYINDEAIKKKNYIKNYLKLVILVKYKLKNYFLKLIQLMI